MPEIATAGSFSFRVAAFNSQGVAVTSTITVSVSSTSTLSAPVFSAQTPPTSATVGTAYGYTFKASGNPAPTYAVYSGALPTGLGLNSTTGLLSGTPSSAGSFSFRVAASNSQGTALTSTITIGIATATVAPLSMEAFPQPLVFKQGATVSYQFRATGGTAPYQFYQSGGIMPAGLTLSVSGLLSGTVLAYPQDFTFYIMVLDLHHGARRQLRDVRSGGLGADPTEGSGFQQPVVLTKGSADVRPRSPSFRLLRIPWLRRARQAFAAHHSNR